MILFWSLVPGSNKSEWDHVVEVGFPNSRTNEQVSLFKLCLSLGEVDCFWVLWNETPLQSCNSKMCLSSSSSSALQLFMSFGLLNSFFPLFPLLHLLFPIFTPILPRSFLTSSSHLNLGLPFGLVAQHTQTSSNSSTIAADSSNGVTNTRRCRYSCMRTWWWVEVPPETCRAVSRYK